MRLRLGSRPMVMAAGAATVVLGSAAAYAITLPELPVKLPGITLEIPVDLPSSLISPPDAQLPANPIIGSPGGDELSDIAKILDPAAPAGSRRGAKPAAKHPVRAPEAAPAPADPDEAAPDRDVPSSLADLFSDDDWGKWGEGNPSVVIGKGINICNNNNVKVIVERDSKDNENTVDQHRSNGDIATNVDGEHSQPADPGISCHN